MLFDKTIRTIHKLTVHAGIFHSDDVFCAALTKLINPDAEIVRVAQADSLDSDVEKGIVVADIGMGQFDHHQADCPYREDGIKHCGASRMWLVYAYSAVKAVFPDCNEAVCEYVSEKVYNHLLQTIAALDNGTEGFPGNVYSAASMVDGFRPVWDSDEAYDEAFAEAQEFMHKILVNEIKKYAAEARAAEYVQECVAKMQNGVVVLEQYCPWKGPVMANEEAKVICYPSMRGGWNAEPVPRNDGDYVYRVNPPMEWRGMRGEAAAAFRKGMHFCHVAGFLLAFDTKEDAIETAHWLVQNCENTQQ